MNRSKVARALVVGIVLVSGAAVGVAAWHVRNGSNRGEVGEVQNSGVEEEAIGVIVGSAELREFRRTVSTSGSVYPVRFALVSARIPGPLDEIFVREGDRVEAGVTKLFQTDSLKLTKALAIARENLRVAECALKEKEALREKTLVAKKQAERDLKRYEELLATNGVSQQMVEHQRALVEQLAVDIKHVETLIELARAQLEQARLAVGVAEKDLSDSLVYAPITGVVEEKYREPGEMAGAGTPVLRIFDPSLVEIRASLPEEYYGAVDPGKTQMFVKVAGRELPAQLVVYKSPGVDIRSRTFEIRCQIASPPPEVVPGALAEVTVVLDQRKGVGVPVDAVVREGDLHVIYVVEDERVRKVPVKIGLRSDGYYEVSGELEAGTPVVVTGQSRLAYGVRVRDVSAESSGDRRARVPVASKTGGV